MVLSGALLFTEVNVEMPATLLRCDARTLASRVGRLWVLAALGNLAGAFVLGYAVHVSQSYSPAFDELLGEIVDSKMCYREIGGANGWFRAVVSGVLGNWLSGSPRSWR